MWNIFYVEPRSGTGPEDGKNLRKERRKEFANKVKEFARRSNQFTLMD